MKRGHLSQTGSAFDRRVSQWTQRSPVKSVQTGTIVVTTAGSNTATITAVDPNNAMLLFGGCTPSGNDVPRSSFARVSLTNATTVTATLNASSGNTVSVVYTVVEFWPGVIRSVQRGTVTVSTTATITAVNIAKAYCAYQGFTTTNATSGDSEHFQLPRVELTNATTVTGTAGATAATIGYQVVEFY